MRRTREETARSREKIIESATRLFRERGPNNVSVAEIMSAAGMTHGGFYTHFESKEALQAAATEHAFAWKLEFLREGLTQTDRANLKMYIDGYLSLDHVHDRIESCPIAGLGLDAERASETVKLAMSEGAVSLLDVFAESLKAKAAEPRHDAIVALSAMIGALVLARATNNLDLQREILDAVRETTALASILD